MLNTLEEYADSENLTEFLVDLPCFSGKLTGNSALYCNSPNLRKFSFSSSNSVNKWFIPRAQPRFTGRDSLYKLASMVCIKRSIRQWLFTCAVCICLEESYPLLFLCTYRHTVLVKSLTECKVTLIFSRIHLWFEHLVHSCFHGWW